MLSLKSATGAGGPGAPPRIRRASANPPVVQARFIDSLPGVRSADRVPPGRPGLSSPGPVASRTLPRRQEVFSRDCPGTIDVCQTLARGPVGPRAAGMRDDPVRTCPMLLGPVFNAELITTARRARYYVVRSVYVLLLLFFIWQSDRAMLEPLAT